MRLIVELPEETYKAIMKGWDARDTTLCALRKATPIPDNATNGDVIKALFPTGEQMAKEPIMRFVVDGLCYEFDYSWWNAPYRKE